MDLVKYSAYYLFLTVAFLLGSNCEKSKAVNSTFKATDQWQKIEEGQSVPKGLHVRINLQTGEKEGKLLEESDDEKKALAETPEFNDHLKGDLNLDPEELKKMMKNLKSDDVKKENTHSNLFRSYDELKREFSDINMLVKTDLEIMTKLIENFRNFNIADSNKDSAGNSDDSDDEEVLSTLVDLEYLVHQFDNAQEFAKLNGFTDVVYKSLNSTNGEIKSEALRLHGSATQSNPKVQVTALELGSVNLLLKILTFEDDINVRSRSLYALSCLLRRFPAAQSKLLTDGGLSVFAKIFDEEKSDLLKLQVKIITLVQDLLFERKDTKMSISEVDLKNMTSAELDDLKERLKQYDKMDLEKKLVEQDWCKRIPKWFLNQNHIRDIEDITSDTKSASTEHPLRDHHDIIEKVVDTLFALSDICRSNFMNDTHLLLLLESLKTMYSELAAKEMDNKDSSSQFYTSLTNVLKILTDKLITVNESRDEL